MNYVVSLNSSENTQNCSKPSRYVRSFLKRAVLFGIEILVFRRHSVLCASELLIIYGFIVCLWCVLPATAMTLSSPTNLFLF